MDRYCITNAQQKNNQRCQEDAPTRSTSICTMAGAGFDVAAQTVSICHIDAR